MVEGGRLQALSRLALAVGAPSIAADAEGLAERLVQGRFYVVCIGQFKRGKSTLINALVGTSAVPTGVVPVTSVITVVRHGEELGARVRFGERGWEDCDVAALAAYVSEEQNPGNEKGVTGAEVFAPAPLLASGLCLVDTPGIGSISTANTAATRAFVPHVDAALIVLGADPPISGEELALVEELAAATPTLVVVMNKADRLPDGERLEATRFTGRVLAERLRRPVEPILHVSALQRIAGAGPARDWDVLVSRLRSLAVGSGADLLEAAEARGTAHLVGRLLHEVDEQERALLRPLEESRQRVDRLRPVVDEAARSIDDLGPRLVAAQERLVQRLVEARDAFVATAIAGATAELREAVGAADGPPSRLRAHALEQARDIARRWLDRWRREQEPRTQALYRDAVARFLELLDTLRLGLAASGLTGLGPLDTDAVLTTRTSFFFTELLRAAPASPAKRLLDALVPSRWRRRAIASDANEYLVRVLGTNTARVTNDFAERVAESRRALEGQLRQQLAEIASTAERAVERARQAQAAGEEAVGRRLETLREARVAVTALGTEAPP